MYQEVIHVYCYLLPYADFFPCLNCYFFFNLILKYEILDAVFIIHEVLGCYISILTAHWFRQPWFYY